MTNDYIKPNTEEEMPSYKPELPLMPEKLPSADGKRFEVGDVVEPCFPEVDAYKDGRQRIDTIQRLTIVRITKLGRAPRLLQFKEVNGFYESDFFRKPKV